MYSSPGDILMCARSLQAWPLKAPPAPGQDIPVSRALTQVFTVKHTNAPT